MLTNVSIACIGPVTAAAAGKLGLNVDIVAQHHTVDGLASALAQRIGSKTPSPSGRGLG